MDAGRLKRAAGQSMDEWSLWGTVCKMRELYGMFAVVTAMQRAKIAQQIGDLDKCDRWTRIAEILSVSRRG
jgi:hypothetical protein